MSMYPIPRDSTWRRKRASASCAVAPERARHSSTCRPAGSPLARRTPDRGVLGARPPSLDRGLAPRDCRRCRTPGECAEPAPVPRAILTRRVRRRRTDHLIESSVIGSATTIASPRPRHPPSPAGARQPRGASPRRGGTPDWTGVPPLPALDRDQDARAPGAPPPGRGRGSRSGRSPIRSARRTPRPCSRRRRTTCSRPRRGGGRCGARARPCSTISGTRRAGGGNSTASRTV